MQKPALIALACTKFAELRLRSAMQKPRVLNKQCV